MAGTFCTLTAGVGYLKNIVLATVAAHGITAADLVLGENRADRTILGALLGYYTKANLILAVNIEEVALLLASSTVIQYKMERHAVEDDDETATPMNLWKEGMSLVSSIQGKTYPRYYLYDASDNIIAMRKGVFVPQTNTADTTFFPENDTDKSHGQTSRSNVEGVFERGNIQESNK